MDTLTQFPDVDAEGYLVEPFDWNEEIAVELARQVIKHLAAKHGPESRNMVFELFPYGYVKQACKIAGMKRPRAWSTG